MKQNEIVYRASGTSFHMDHIPINPLLQKYYDQADLWDNDYGSDSVNRDRLRLTAEALPREVQSVLDVGCANGKALHSILEGRRNRNFDYLVGVDMSARALAKFDLPRASADCSSLPFADRSFDAVLCLEVLEHLPQAAFKRTLNELQRVTGRYLIVSVPNDEDLKMSAVMCPKCFCWFNSCFHMRSFDEARLRDLFAPLFEVFFIKEIGPLTQYYRIDARFQRIRRYLKEVIPPATAICPQCGHQPETGRETTIGREAASNPMNWIVSKFKGLAKRALPRTMKGQWLLAVYERLRRGGIE